MHSEYPGGAHGPYEISLENLSALSSHGWKPLVLMGGSGAIRISALVASEKPAHVTNQAYSRCGVSLGK